MLNSKRLWLLRCQRGMVSICVALIVFTFVCPVSGVPPSPPSCDEPGQPTCQSFGVSPGRFPGPGTFNVTITARVITLTGPITCNLGVAITPVGPPQQNGDDQITPAVIEIPSSLAITPQKPGSILDCSAVTSIGSWNFVIAVGPEPPPPGPPPGPPPRVAQFDTNGNGVIDDREFFAVIDKWVAGQFNNELFFLVIDAWVSQSPIGGAAISAPDPVELVINSTKGHITFTVQRPGIAGMALEIFDLNGRRVFFQEVAWTRLMWNLRTQSGQPLATGLYLYVVTVRGYEGKVIRSQVKKLLHNVKGPQK